MEAINIRWSSPYQPMRIITSFFTNRIARPSLPLHTIVQIRAAIYRIKRRARRNPPTGWIGQKNNNACTCSRPNGVVGFTGQRSVAPAAGEVHVRLTQVALLHQEEPLIRPLILTSNLRLVASYQEELGGSDVAEGTFRGGPA
jgi:hypothetical protein